LVIPSEVRLKNLDCAIPSTMLPGAPPEATAAGAAPAGGTDVTLTGLTFDSDDVAEFMTRLGLIPQLRNIQLASTTRTEMEGAESGAPTEYRWEFSITAQLRPHQTPPPTTTLAEEGAP
jgi:Tfp pilus assembly protein PilN